MTVLPFLGLLLLPLLLLLLLLLFGEHYVLLSRLRSGSCYFVTPWGVITGLGGFVRGLGGVVRGLWGAVGRLGGLVVLRWRGIGGLGLFINVLRRVDTLVDNDWRLVVGFRCVDVDGIGSAGGTVLLPRGLGSVLGSAVGLLGRGVIGGLSSGLVSRLCSGLVGRFSRSVVGRLRRLRGWVV